MTPPLFRKLAATLLASSCILAQQPSNWTTLTLPAGVTSTNSIGTTTTFRTNREIWLYSGITKQWTVLPVPPTATLFQANDYCIVQDGTRIHGYASHTGAIDTVEVNLPATVVSGPASSSWVTLRGGWERPGGATTGPRYDPSLASTSARKSPTWAATGSGAVQCIMWPAPSMWRRRAPR